MLGKMLLGKRDNLAVGEPKDGHNWRDDFEAVEWVDPNAKNLVAEGVTH